MSDCRRFERLLDEDRVLTADENAFVQTHRERCDICRTNQEAAEEAFSCLRDQTIHEVTGGHRFDVRLLRRYRVQRTKEGVRYWLPAFAGAAAASFALVAVLTLVTRPRDMKPGGLPTGQARRMEPSLELRSIPNLTR